MKKRISLGPDTFPIQMGVCLGDTRPIDQVEFEFLSSDELQSAFQYEPDKGEFAKDVYSPTGWFGLIQVTFLSKLTQYIIGRAARSRSLASARMLVSTSPRS